MVKENKIEETYNCIFCKRETECRIVPDNQFEELQCKTCNKKLAWRLKKWKLNL